MSTLRQRLDRLASAFVAGVLDAIRGASLEEVAAESSNGGSNSSSSARLGAGTPKQQLAGAPRRKHNGRLPRRSAQDISNVVDRIVSLLKQHPKGLRAEEIRDKLEMQAKELPRPIQEALSSRRITRSGAKRATRYFAKVAGGAPVKTKGRPGKKGKGGRKAKAPAAAAASTNGPAAASQAS